MPDGPAYALRAAARSLHEVIEPALHDGANPLAREQARLVGQYLDFLSGRWDDMPDLARFELRHQMALVDLVLEELGKDDHRADCLRSAAARARATDDAGDVANKVGELARRELLTALSALIRDLGCGRSHLRESVERLVVASERELVGVRRSWFAPQGWEPDPSAVPPLDLVNHTFRRDS